jgi:hypothetical protein
MVRLTSPVMAVSAVALAGLVCGVGGWFLGAQDEPVSSGRPAFEAFVESVREDGREACLAPVDPTLLQDLGGSVCGQIFIAPGTDASQDARVRVRWFTTVGEPDDQTVETFVLEPSDRSG